MWHPAPAGRAQPSSAPGHISPRCQPRQAALNRDGDVCVSPCHPHVTATTCQTARGSGRSLCRWLCRSRTNCTAGFIGPSLASFSRSALWTPVMSQHLFGVCVHTDGSLFNYISITAGSSGMHRSHGALWHHRSRARCHPQQPSTPSPPSPFWMLSMSLLCIAAASRSLHGQLDVVKAQIPGKRRVN